MAKPVTVKVVQLPTAEGLELPEYQTEGAAGVDLRAAVPEGEPLTIKAREHALVPTGLVIELPAGFEGQVRPRSGLAAKHGVTVLNSPGTIDSDYRGEVQVILINHGRKAFVVNRGERIAQLVVAPVTRARLVPAVKLSASARGAGGFGSTGSGTAESAAARKTGKKSKSSPAVRLPAKRGRRSGS